MKNKMIKLFFYIMLIIIILLGLGFIIYNQIIEYYQQLDPMLQVIQDTLSPLHQKVQDITFYEGNKSYTINKKKIYLCLRDKNKEYYDFNMLLYVAIHELAHVLCDEIGHTSKFNHIFHKLLEKAESIKIYDPNKPIIQNYCNH